MDRDKLDPAYDPYRFNTRSITAASRAAGDAGQVPDTKATSGSYFYDTIICVFFTLCLSLYFCYYITNKFLFIEAHERERDGNGDHGGRGGRGVGHG